MIVRVGFLDKDENYIARLANYYSAHANETVQFEIYLFTKEEALRKQLSRGGRMDLLVAEEDLLPEPEEYSRNMELAFWSTEKHEQKRNGYPVVFRYQKASEIFREFQSMAAKRGHGASSFEMQANGQVVLFINGAGGAGSGTAAAGCAAAMAAQGKNTVCFTLKQNACNDSFDICGSSMTDVMYEISMWRQLGGKDQGQLQMKLQSMLKQDNETEVYSFAPFDLPVSAMNPEIEEAYLEFQKAAEANSRLAERIDVNHVTEAQMQEAEALAAQWEALESKYGSYFQIYENEIQKWAGVDWRPQIIETVFLSNPVSRVEKTSDTLYIYVPTGTRYTKAIMDFISYSGKSESIDATDMVMKGKKNNLSQPIYEWDMSSNMIGSFKIEYREDK